MNKRFSPEYLAELAGADVIRSEAFAKKVDDLVNALMDDVVFEAAGDLRHDYEKRMFVRFPDTDEGENAEIEFGMTLHGEIERALTKAIVEKLREEY